MAKWGVEAGSCTGRGFAEVDADGYMAKFEAWVVKTPANHGPGWFIIEDQTNITAFTVDSSTDVNTTTEEITKTSHGLSNGRAVLYTAGTAAIAGLTTGTVYYVIRVSADAFSLATTEANAYSGTAINLTSTGTGTQTFTPRDPFIICSDVQTPVVNDYNTGQSGGAPKFIRAGYVSTEAGYVRMQSLLWWDTTAKKAQGYFGGGRIATLDSQEFAYHFAAGAEAIGLFARIGTAWSNCILDEFESYGATFLEGTDKVGVLQSGITAGTSVVLQLATGEAANFTVGKNYYLYDLDGHTWVDYATVTARDTGAHTVTLNIVNFNFPAGAVLCAYAHRHVFFTSNYTGGTNMSSYSYTGYRIPYVSSLNSASYVVHNQTGEIMGVAGSDSTDQAFSMFASVYNRGTSVSESDDWLCWGAPILEIYRHNSVIGDSTSMNRILGKLKNIKIFMRGSLAQMQDTRTLNSIAYIVTDTNTYCRAFRHTEATS